MTLELLAIRWLRFEKRCRVAMVERSPRLWNGRPDVLAITKSGHLLEIEIKRSIQDFRANADKPHIRRRSIAGNGFLAGEDDMAPQYFWYLVPPELVKKAEAELPPWAGLLRGPGEDEIQSLHSVVKAPKNKASKRLTIREKVNLGQCMANQILSYFERMACLKSDYDPDPWYPQI